MGKNYPFKFLESYTREDIDIFFGRDDEIGDLYEMVFQTNILLVHGASGTGKTSLIQCGLAKKFQSYDWQPLLVRRNTNINDALLQALKSEIPDSDLTAGNISFRELIEAVFIQSFRPIYLIFDQFEELYILGTKDEHDAFVTSIIEILNIGDTVKAVIVIREEYLGYLYNFEKRVPQLLRKKIRVESMNYDKVRNVLLGINAIPDSLFTLKKGEEKAVIDKVFETVRGDANTLTIELTYLQVFLDKLYMSIAQDKQRETRVVCCEEHVTALGKIGDVLRSFLDDQVKKIYDEIHANHQEISIEAIWQMLSKFVTFEGTKEPVSPTVLRERLDEYDPALIGEILKKFAERKIIKYSERDRSYEIIHDSLAQRIAEKRSTEEIALLRSKKIVATQISLSADARGLLTENQLILIEPYLDEVRLSNEEKDLVERSRQRVAKDKRFRRGQLWLLRGIAALLFVGLLFGLALYQDKNEAFQDKNKAFEEADSLRKISGDRLQALRTKTQENAELNYKMSEMSYQTFLELSNASYRQFDFQEAHKFAKLAIKADSAYTGLAQSADTLYKIKTIDANADSARRLMLKINEQITIQKSIDEVKSMLERGKSLEVKGSLNDPTEYFNAKIAFDSALAMLRRIPHAAESGKIAADIADRQQRITDKIQYVMDWLIEKASVYLKDPEGFSRAGKLLTVAEQAERLLNRTDPRISELRKKMATEQKIALP